jgi:drug/metabolite transporter (DMT)-like permease
LATNYAFAGAAASFVETVKAAEPITSATVASWYGIETITTEQKFSLGTIIVGVLFSTMGGGGGNSTTKHGPTTTITTTQTMMETIRACIIVMTANLCFSYRGLFQKLFRQHPSSQQYDDLNLQYRMQWYGVLILSVPTFLFDIMPYFLREILLPKSVENPTEHHFDEVMVSNVLFRYILLSLFNGISFTCYNLASTWILSRISVVHHAALNCIRRVFAVIVTSIFFGVPITFTGAIGIALAVIGFMSYTHYKVIQQQQQQEQQQQPQQAAIGTISPGQSRTKQISYSLP